MHTYFEGLANGGVMINGSFTSLFYFSHFMKGPAMTH